MEATQRRVLYRYKKGEVTRKQNTFDVKALSYEAPCYFRGLVDLKDGYLDKTASNIAESDRQNPEFKKQVSQ